jgi:hypothetical protein
MTTPRPLDRFYATLILNILTKPFEAQKAFELGIIDKNGNQIKKPVTEEETEAYNSLYQVTFGIKKIIDSFAPTKNRVKLFAVGMNFIRQQVVPSQFVESINYNRFLKELNLVIENNLVLVEEEILIDRYLSEEGDGGAAASSPSADVPENSTENIDIHTPVINKMFRKKKEIKND